ncbi:BA14K family protein [Ochrobactrum sp. CM-21-5]|nr:BA14K family protein [Ochrobactrum sp. CM-21-5]MBC2885884.1 BA14K family protein [Ochrobactrum sp. CM-21-5]
MLGRILRLGVLSALFTASLAGTGMAVELRNSQYLPSLKPNGPLIIGGQAGANRTAPGARNCYGSTLCRESGSYITEHGVLNYKNGDPLEYRRTVQPPTAGTRPSSSHIRWCSNQYRSYRTSDDTYQPMAGPRTSCNSPFQ